MTSNKPKHGNQAELSFSTFLFADEVEKKSTKKCARGKVYADAQHQKSKNEWQKPSPMRLKDPTTVSRKFPGTISKKIAPVKIFTVDVLDIL